MKKLTLVQKNGEKWLLSDIEVAPDQAWLDIQNKRPLSEGSWNRGWPLLGGQGILQQGTYQVIGEATESDIQEAISGHGFNPAANAIKTYINS
jgi:hypothetical protein